MRFWLPICALVSGCFGLSLGDEPFVCGGEGTLCPPGYGCVFGVCTREGLPDAAPPDAAVACAPNSLLECVDGDSARVCNGEGDGVLDLECPGGCGDVCIRCEPGTVTCADDQLETCGPGGDVIARQTCHAGCDGSTAPNACLYLDPQNLPASTCAASDATDLVVEGEVAWDTASCATFGGTRTTTDIGEVACVLTVRRLSLREDGALVVVGDVPLIVVALEEMKLAGRLRAGATATARGPGASQDLGFGGVVDGESNQGGGGGGHQTSGGTGAAGGTGPKTIIAGGAIFGEETLSPLVGGGDGGRGGDPCGLGGCPITPIDRGGGGGGAVQLVACERLEIAPTARIDAGGGGGGGGKAAAVVELAKPGLALLIPAGGGSGGGAGGAILLEAPEISVPGGAKLTAGGGGGGGGGGGTAGSAGHDATDEVPAKGGTGGGGAGGQGGVGIDGDQLPQGGASNNGGGAGGGGGAPGRIRLDSRPDRPVEVAPGARVFPPASRGEIGRSL